MKKTSIFKDCLNQVQKRSILNTREMMTKLTNNQQSNQCWGETSSCPSEKELLIQNKLLLEENDMLKKMVAELMEEKPDSTRSLWRSEEICDELRTLKTNLRRMADKFNKLRRRRDSMLFYPVIALEICDN
eukprot:TRINITY_DN7148_c0_g2_i5.p1 TRINITY_DN7148_c0_g2~~TRINITY_DN7148_c0_g2_i5.p1  ORF type:complete len:131 (-),score=35.17 TRINITY_DN7148_c0_g2_i5:120-512(-)